ncbi:MAG TPA: GNAT family N-acetyltransferase [Acidimicrobiia bacterium]|nr:GNAT family N-acetyltransferase [Acidimicrobiia bacterium]
MITWPLSTELPDGYPHELQGDFVLSDGRRVWIRPILPTDATDLAQAIADADSETLLHRFFTGAPNLSEKQIHYLSEVDYKRRLALVAADEEGRGVAVGRYESHSEGGAAEVAIAVAPEWRSGGLATEILRRLEEPARVNGFTTLDAVYMPENRPVARVFEHLGYSDQRIEDGVARVSKLLV